MGRNHQQRRQVKSQSQAELERAASQLISEALRWVVLAHRPRWERIVEQLTALGATPEGGRAITAVLSRTVEGCLSALWEHGWQPLDVHRIAGRRLTKDERDLVVDMMAAQAASYAAAIVDPRWTAQLREVGAADAAGAATYLERHLLEHGWEPLITHTATIVNLFMRLPALEVLMPTPGTYRASATSRSGDSIDERILRRVRALLAKAESTNYEAEAETFTAGAQALMARHSIDAALLAAQAPSGQRPQARRIGIDNPYEAQKTTLLHEVASANRCRTVWSKELGFVTVIGFESDLDAVEVLFTSLLVQATRAMTAAGRRTDRYGRSRTRVFRSSFLTAYAGRIGERLREAAAAQVEAMQREADQEREAGEVVPGYVASRTRPTSASGRELVPVLTARSAEVDEAMHAMFPTLMHQRPGGSYDAEGWSTGRAAADLASLGTGAALSGRSATATG